jgi:rhodanese-related sulfurtransferase
MTNEIDARSLQQGLSAKDAPLVLDVRNADEVRAEGHIEGALLIPMNELPSRLAEVPDGRAVVTVCKRGMRSFNAAAWLRQMGRNATSLQGGIDQWKALGLPLAR